MPARRPPSRRAKGWTARPRATSPTIATRGRVPAIRRTIPGDEVERAIGIFAVVVQVGDQIRKRRVTVGIERHADHAGELRGVVVVHRLQRRDDLRSRWAADQPSLRSKALTTRRFPARERGDKLANWSTLLSVKRALRGADVCRRRRACCQTTVRRATCARRWPGGRVAWSPRQTPLQTSTPEPLSSRSVPSRSPARTPPDSRSGDRPASPSNSALIHAATPRHESSSARAATPHHLQMRFQRSVPRTVRREQATRSESRFREERKADDGASSASGTTARRPETAACRCTKPAACVLFAIARRRLRPSNWGRPGEDCGRGRRSAISTQHRVEISSSRD